MACILTPFSAQISQPSISERRRLTHFANEFLSRCLIVIVFYPNAFFPKPNFTFSSNFTSRCQNSQKLTWVRFLRPFNRFLRNGHLKKTEMLIFNAIGSNVTLPLTLSNFLQPLLLLSSRTSAKRVEKTVDVGQVQVVAFSIISKFFSLFSITTFIRK